MAERLTRQQQRERNRARLLEAAEKVFAERGIEGASLDDVAAEAGLTKGAVYSNFDSKDDLILQVMWSRAGTPEAVEFHRLLASGKPPERLVEDWGTLWAALVRGGESAHHRRVALDFLTLAYALRHPAVGERFARFLLSPVEGDRHPLAPPGSELAKLAPEHAERILKALEVGMAAQSLLDSDRCPPELYGVALKILTGATVEPTDLPAARPTEATGGDAG